MSKRKQWIFRYDYARHAWFCRGLIYGVNTDTGERLVDHAARCYQWQHARKDATR